VASYYFASQFVENRFVTPADAGVQRTRLKRINTVLDTGFRRYDEIMADVAIVLPWV